MRTFTQKLTCLLVLLLCCYAPYVTADDLTVADGSVESQFLPFDGFYVDQAGTRGQSLYPASLLTQMDGGTITKMRFYLKEKNYSGFGSAVFKVSLGETTDEMLTPEFIEDGLAQVYSGSLNPSQDTFEVFFQNSYIYTGGNLVVDFQVTKAGSCPQTYFKGINSAYSGHSNKRGANVQDFLPKATFEFTSDNSGCTKPSGFSASGITARGALLSWEGGSGTYNVEYKKAGAADWTSALANTTLLSTQLNNLDPRSGYQARVQSYCEEIPSSSIWRQISFKTAIGLPYAETFDNSGVPDDWEKCNGWLDSIMDGKPLTGTGNVNSYWEFGAKNGMFDNHAFMKVYNPCSAWLVSPTIPLESNTQLAFDLGLTHEFYDNVPAKNQPDARFVVLISTDNRASWTVLREWNNTGSADVFNQISYTAFGEEETIGLNDYAGQNVQIAFYLEHKTNTNDEGANIIHLDNVKVAAAPSCVKPTSLAADNISKNSVQLSWNAASGESAWRVLYKKISDADWQFADVTENPYTLSGLTPYSDYEVQVAAICSALDTSEYTHPVIFKTAAGVPFAEAFNTSLPEDWSRYSGLLNQILSGEESLVLEKTTSTTVGWQVGAKNNAFENNIHLWYNICGTSCKHWVVSPAVELDNNVQLSFDLALTKQTGTLVHVDEGAQDDDKFVVLISTDGGANWSELRVWDNGLSEDKYDNISNSVYGQPVAIDLSAYAGEKVQIAFYGESTEGQSTNGNNLHIANVLIDYIPACPKPTGLAVSNITSAAASFTWDEANDNSATWAFCLKANAANDFAPTDADFTGSASEPTATIDTLQENTSYIFFLRRTCGVDGNSDYLKCKFRTTQNAALIPYSDDFENGENWYPINGPLANAWSYGTATHNGEGSHALYISNDGGATNAYTYSSAAATVYAEKLFNLEKDGTYIFKYDWKAKGGGNNNFLRVALIPASVELVANTSLPTGLSATTLPDGWIALDGGSKLNGSTVWNTKEANQYVTAGQYKVVFVWSNNASGYSSYNPPAAIDNFSISRIPCVQTSMPIAAGVTATTADITWVGGDKGQTAWQIAIDTTAGFDPDTLSSLIDITTKPYTLENLEEVTTYYIYLRANCGSEDGYSDWSPVGSFTTFSSCQLPDALAASELTDSSAVISWNKYFTDNFNLRYSTDGINWNTKENVACPDTLKGLIENTYYQVQVQAICNTAEWSDLLTFRTEQTAIALPYSDDFENGNAWRFYNGDITNAWVLGDAAHNGEGSHALYISNDGGTTNAYTLNAEAMVYATKSFEFEGGVYAFSYDWKANGQKNNDYLRVALAPVSNLVAGTKTLPSFSYNGLPSGWIALDGGNQLFSSTEWQTYAIDEIEIPAGNYMVVFAWRNNNSSGTQTPAAIDNFSARKVTCLKPNGLNAALTPGNGSIATLNWTANGSETDWVVEYSTAADFAGALSQNASGLPTINLTDLTPETQYYARVKAACGENEESTWSESISFIPTDAYSLLINDGTDINKFVPFYAYYADHLTHTQFIIPETDLNAIKGDTIKQLTFYCTEESHDFGTAIFDIYMAAEDGISVSSISGLSDWDALTNVKADCGLSVSNNQLTIALDDPFEYPGGTLMIGFNQTIVGTCTGYSFYWYGIAATEAAYGGYGTSLSKRDFVPKMTINYAPHKGIETGISNGVATDHAVKFIRNRQVYILVNGVVYDTMGRKVEVKK